jgi:hypothetical protein
MTDVRITGHGVTQDPIRRDHLCSYKGCDQSWQGTRVSKSGSVIAYCNEHLQRASRLFVP